MQNRRDFIKSGAALGASLTSIVGATSVFARSKSPDGLQLQHWFHETSFDLEQDNAAARASGRTLTLLWEQEGCHYCKKMHDVVFARDDIVDLIRKKFLVVQMDLWGKREFRGLDGKVANEQRMARNYLVRGTPTTLFFDDIGDVIFRMPGYGEPPVFKGVFRYVDERAYEGRSFNDWFKAQNIDWFKAQNID